MECDPVPVGPGVLAHFCNFKMVRDSKHFCWDLWETSGGDQTWTHKSAFGTSSTGTGPSRGPDGGAYVYTEASNNYNKVDCLGLPQGRCPEVLRGVPPSFFLRTKSGTSGGAAGDQPQ